MEEVFEWPILNWTIICDKDNFELAKYLIEEASDDVVNIEDRDEKGRTPLIWAIKIGNLAKVQYLVDKGADTEAENNKGKKVKIYAKEKGNKEIISYLSERNNKKQK